MTAAPLFVHLHLHSEFSLADGLIRIKPLMHAAAEMHMPAVALTDLNNLFAMVKFYKAALAAGIKPLVGMEIQVNTGVLDESVPVVLLAMNTDGYRNLSTTSGSRGDRGTLAMGRQRRLDRFVRRSTGRSGTAAPGWKAGATAGPPCPLEHPFPGSLLS